LDVGATDVNGNFRGVVTSRGWQYTGLDIAPGKNIDVVTADPYRFPFQRESFDIVISGSTMEHVKAVWLWVPELVRVLKPGGLLAIHTHMAWIFHPHPVDCWRIMPDGMRYLFDLTGQLERYTIEQIATSRYECLKTDILGVAWKRSDI
jgi:SAM-dependent methyltransferase